MNMEPLARPTRVLVIDDDQVDRQATRRALAGRYAVFEAEDRDQVLQLLDEHQPSCVLLDYNIPGTDTLTLLEEIWRRVPVIMLTGNGDEAMAVAAMKAGAHDYLSKNGCTPEALDAAIRQAIAKSQRQRAQTESRARLRSAYLQEKEKRHELESSLQVARDIQQNLIPSGPPDLVGFDIAGIYLPADATGGDFFDYLPLADGGLGLVVVDVSGHGIGPALLAAETRAYIRALARIESHIGQVATLVNRLLWEDMSGNYFATFCLIKLHPASRTLTYAAAGHRAYVVHPSGDCSTLDSKCLPLGVFADTAVPTSEPFALRQGDIVFLATDGISDTKNTDDARFGTERCLRFIHAVRSHPAEKIIDQLVHAARTFAAGIPQPDDVTVVIAKVM